MPGLLHDYLKLATEGKLVTRTDPRDQARLRADAEASSRRMLKAISGSALFFSGAVLTGLNVGPFYLLDASTPGLVSMAIGAWLLWRANAR